MVAPNCLHGKRDSTHLGDGKCMYHFTPLAQGGVKDLVLITDQLWWCPVSSRAPESAEYQNTGRGQRVCMHRHCHTCRSPEVMIHFLQVKVLFFRKILLPPPLKNRRFKLNHWNLIVKAAVTKTIIQTCRSGMMCIWYS